MWLSFMRKDIHLCILCDNPIRYNYWFPNHSYCRLAHYRCQKIVRKGLSLLKGKKYLATNEITLIHKVLNRVLPFNGGVET